MTAAISTDRSPIILFGPLESYDWLVNAKRNTITIADHLDREDRILAIEGALDALDEANRPTLAVVAGDGKTTKRRANLRLVPTAAGA